MNKNGPIIVIEDDLDDQEILKMVFENLNYNNKVIFFSDGQEALYFLNGSDIIPFLILSDINLPKLDGFALRRKIHMDAQLQVKCIPYLFFTTASNQQSVIEAYSMSVQGFFIKPGGISELEETLNTIIKYWKSCVAPNNFSETWTHTRKPESV